MIKGERCLQEILIDPMPDKKTIQFTNLSRFVETYKPSIEILEHSRSIHFAKEKLVCNVILFFDQKLLPSTLHVSSFFSSSRIDIVKIQNGLDRLWSAFVEGCLSSENQERRNFLEANDLAAF